MQQSFVPKLVKLDFPRFNGNEDMMSWTCRVEQFVQFHQTPEKKRVALASFHLEGDAQLWYQIFKQEVARNVRYYQTQFEKLLTKVGYLSPDRQGSHFINWLKDNIKADVLAGRPTTFSSAIGLTRLYEARNFSEWRADVSIDVKKTPTTSKKTINNGYVLPVRRLSLAEMQERRAKGLCCNCNEKFVLGYRHKKLFLIEDCHEEEDDYDKPSLEEDVPE
ncbi:hypothetical protein AMTRI_Chr06g192850 [Amborella trichopoda]